MTFDSLIEFNAHIASERPSWRPNEESIYSDSYGLISQIVSKHGEMAVVALFAIAQECIKDPECVAD
jgi:hypothetical protein